MSAPRILIVEDDVRLRQALRLCFDHLGYPVWEAASCAETLVLAERHKPDLILLDLGLPDGDGLEVARELRRRPTTTRIPIAILTGEWLVGNRAEILSSICAGIIPKPVTLERLERDLRLIIAGRRERTRRFPRYVVEAPVQWRPRGITGPDDPAYALGVARILSEGGLMVELPERLAIASLVDLQVDLPGGPLAAGGKVVWSRSREIAKGRADAYAHGIQFLEMNATAQAALRTAIDTAGSSRR